MQLCAKIWDKAKKRRANAWHTAYSSFPKWMDIQIRSLQHISRKNSESLLRITRPKVLDSVYRAPKTGKGKGRKGRSDDTIQSACALGKINGSFATTSDMLHLANRILSKTRGTDAFHWNAGNVQRKSDHNRFSIP